MRGTGAARRQREQEPDEPDPVTAAVAALTRLAAGTGDLIARMGQRDSEIAAAAAAVQARRPDGDALAALGGEITSRQGMQLVETISLAAHLAEAREVLEGLGPQLAALYEMGIAEGRDRERREAAARAAQVPAPGPRHARGRKPGPGIGSAATRAAAAGIVVVGSLTGAGFAAVHDESSVTAVASAASSPAWHRMPPDTAVLLPVSASLPTQAYQPRHAKPSADAATATPAPSPSLPALGSPSPPPASASPVLFDGSVNLQTLNVTVGPSGRARIVFTASGGPLEWSASVSGPVTLRTYGGALQDGQSAVIVVTVQGGGTGSAVVTIQDQNGNATQVPVTWVALPVL